MERTVCCHMHIIKGKLNWRCKTINLFPLYRYIFNSIRNMVVKNECLMKNWNTYIQYNDVNVYRMLESIPTHNTHTQMCMTEWKNGRQSRRRRNPILRISISRSFLRLKDLWSDKRACGNWTAGKWIWQQIIAGESEISECLYPS